MTPKPLTDNTLFYGDNLPILREYIPDESLNLVYSPVWQRDYPRLQLLTVEQLLTGARVEMPPGYGTFKRAERVVQVDEVQGRLDL